jgi:putative transposase
MNQLCAWYGISRQAYYQLKRQQRQRQAEAAQVVELVQQVRQRHPRMGGRKLYHRLQPQLHTQGLHLGRDRFFEVLRDHDLLVRPKKRAYRTTWAGRWRCENLLTQTVITRPNQAWVCDLTYLTTEAGFVFLALVTDLYSRRIMGHDLSASLTLDGAKRAGQMAIAQAAPHSLAGLIHHSDHGVQYTSGPYRQLLTDHSICSSMGEVGNCYDNAVAERVNGILKLEYSLGDIFVDLVQAQRAVAQAVWLYNHERPHLSLNYQTPYSSYVNYFTHH